MRKRLISRKDSAFHRFKLWEARVLQQEQDYNYKIIKIIFQNLGCYGTKQHPITYKTPLLTKELRELI